MLVNLTCFPREKMNKSQSAYIKTVSFFPMFSHPQPHFWKQTRVKPVWNVSRVTGVNLPAGYLHCTREAFAISLGETKIDSGTGVGAKTAQTFPQFTPRWVDGSSHDNRIKPVRPSADIVSILFAPGPWILKGAGLKLLIVPRGEVNKLVGTARHPLDIIKLIFFPKDPRSCIEGCANFSLKLRQIHSV